VRLSQSRRALRAKAVALETVILFWAGGVLFAIAADSVEEIREVAGLQKLSLGVAHQKFAKVTHTVASDGQNHFVVDACAHFGMRSGQGSRLMVLRHAAAAVMVDAVDRMQDIHSIQALPVAFRGVERSWYRGLTIVKGKVVPLVRPEAFLTRAEASLLQAALRAGETTARSVAVTA
jgi:chemotaxis signal transduction protein